MPTISEFFGIFIMMYADEHDPPHFHARYQEYRISVDIRKGIVKGRFPPRHLRFVLEWLELHRTELLADWELLRAGQDAKPIAGLEE